MNSKLVVSILPRDTGDALMQSANKAGARGGTILVGTGTSQYSVIQFLGLGDSTKDVLFTIVDGEIEEKVIEAIITKFDSTEAKKLRKGCIFSVDVTDFIRCGTNIKSDDTSEDKENAMSEEYTMITAILNKGYAEDAMAAAREAGAKGGTILAAHGTAKPGDDTFFGVDIVPEKDMLLILVPAEDSEKVVGAIQNLECLKKPGSGVTFCVKAHNFTLLGKK